MLGIFCSAFVGLLALAGYLSDQGPAYFSISVAGTAFVLVWQLTTWNPDDSKSSFTRFDMNGRWVGGVIASGLILDYLLSHYGFQW